MALRNPDTQGDASAEQGALLWILQQHFFLNKKKKALEKEEKSKNLVLCFTVAASKLTMQPKCILSWHDYSRFLS